MYAQKMRRERERCMVFGKEKCALKSENDK
jgi:hypothetical protein